MLSHPKLLKAARLSLELSQDDLATSAKISLRSLIKLELSNPNTTVRTVEAVQSALERHGVVFVSDDKAEGFMLPRNLLPKLVNLD